MSTTDASITAIPDNAIGAHLFEAIARFLDGLGVPRGLKAVGYTKADVEAVIALKARGGALASLVDAEGWKGRFVYHAGARPWTLLPVVHVALPCATQNEISGAEAEALIQAGAKIVAEGSNMVRARSLLSLWI